MQPTEPFDFDSFKQEAMSVIKCPPCLIVELQFTNLKGKILSLVP
jgi:hypothetical protein